MKPKRIAIGCDHRGYPLKKQLVEWLRKTGYEVKDFGTDSETSCDYPDFGIKTALAVKQGESDRGIVICHTGTGMSIAANKVKGIRAALCATVEAAELSRKHNNANVLALGAGFTSFDLAKKICLTWLETQFEGDRHERRIKKIASYEQSSRDRKEINNENE